MHTPVEEVWDAVRDFGSLRERLAAGFVTAVVVEGDTRAVTFFNGAVLHERLISSDDERRRLAWTIIDGPWEHHNGSAEVRPTADGGSCVVWTTDILPDETAGETAALVDKGCESIKQTLDGKQS